MAASASPTLLMVVLELNKSSGSKRTGSSINQTAFAEAVLVFLNAYRMLDRDNMLGVLSAASHGSEFMLVPHKDSSRFSAFAHGFSSKVQTMMAHADSSDTAHDGLAAALSKALCYISRVRRSDASLTARVLVIRRSSHDIPWQYISLMNSIFCSQKLGIPIDVCMLASEDSCFMQQASHITDGIYHRIERPKQAALLQFLLAIFLPRPALRESLLLPTQKTVDFRAVCFCCEPPKLIDKGYVCSVCLSIFCQQSDVCSTCNTKAADNN